MVAKLPAPRAGWGVDRGGEGAKPQDLGKTIELLHGGNGRMDFTFVFTECAIVGISCLPNHLPNG